MSYGLDVYKGAIWFLCSKRLSNQFITFTWFLLNTCGHFGSNIKPTCTLVIQQTAVNCGSGYVEFEQRRRQPWRWHSFIHECFIHNSSNLSQLETLRGPWKIPLFSSVFHKALSDVIMVCWYVLVKNSGIYWCGFPLPRGCLSSTGLYFVRVWRHLATVFVFVLKAS